MERFTGSFTQQEPIPEDGIEAAVAVLRSGRLHRYNTAPGEVAETVLLEEEFAALTGAKYCLAVASGGYALGCALRAVGVEPGQPVLTNAFTLAPVRPRRCCANTIRSPKINRPSGVPVSARKSPVR